jgi:hypothetical protein
MFDENGQIYTFDVYRLWAGWDGGTIHDAFRDFSQRTHKERDSFCSFAMWFLDNGQIKDIENGFLATFFRVRLGVTE